MLMFYVLRFSQSKYYGSQTKQTWRQQQIREFLLIESHSSEEKLPDPAPALESHIPFLGYPIAWKVFGISGA